MKIHSPRSIIGISASLACLFIFSVFSSGPLAAQESRSLQADLFLIVDGSAGMDKVRDGALAWVRDDVIDGILQEGDTVTIWSAGEKTALLYSDAVGAKKDPVKAVFADWKTSGEKADFSAALQDAVSRAAKADKKRLEITILVSGSANALAPHIQNSLALYRYSRVYEAQGWQALIIDPSIAGSVKEAAASYMAER